METVCFCSELFFWCWKPLLKLGGILKEKHLPASGNHFLWFCCQTKQFFRIAETYFSANALFRVVKTDFLASTNHFLYIISETAAGESFFLSSGNVFLNESFIPAIGEGFFSLMESVTLLESFFSTSGNRHCYESRPTFKDKTYSSRWKLTFRLVETIFLHCLIYFQGALNPITLFLLVETDFSD